MHQDAVAIDAQSKPLVSPLTSQEVACRDLTVDLLRSSGFQDPILVQAERSISGTEEVRLVHAAHSFSSVSAATASPDIQCADLYTKQTMPIPCQLISEGLV